MKLSKVVLGCTAAACLAGCSSDPEGFAKAIDIIGTTAAAVIDATQPPPPPPPPTVVVAQPVVAAPVVATPVVAQPVIAQPVVAAPVVQAPVVQAPVVQAPVDQPPAVQAPVAQPPAVQAPAVQPVAAPVQEAVQQAAAPVTAAALPRTRATDTAEPAFKYGTLTFEKPATPEQILAAKEKVAAANPTRLTLSIDKADEATVAAACATFPQADRVTVNNTPLASAAPFALLTNVTRLEIKNVKNLDIAPLATLRKLETVSFSYSQVLDLAPLAALPALKEAEFYGAEVVSFAPLAACPQLKRVYFYAAKTTPEGYASLGTLKQVKQFHGGLTKMTSIAWLRQVPQAEEVQIFAEKIADLSPLASLPNLKYLRLWNMKGGNLSTPVGDLALLAPCTKLERLELPGSAYTNTDALAGLPALKSVDLSGAQNPVSVAFAAKLPALTSLNVSSATVTDGNLVASLPKTVRVRSDKKTVGLPAANP